MSEPRQHWRERLIVAALIAACLTLLPLLVGTGRDASHVPVDIELDEHEVRRLRAQMLAAPPKQWLTRTGEPSEQRDEFLGWFLAEAAQFPATRPELGAQVLAWMHDEARHFSEQYTCRDGTRYRVEFDRYEDGAECTIVLIGSTHWRN